MNRRDFLKATGVGLAALSVPQWLARADEKTPPQRKPNIILIYVDDMGIGDVSCCGGPIPTPHIDALAKGGTRFEYCYSTPLCGPSRFQTLTGRYPFRTGLINNNSPRLNEPKREVMIPRMLKPAGYVTASCGKWGQIFHSPREWGFDEWLMFAGNGVYWREQSQYYTVSGVRRELLEGQYLPDIMHDFAVDFVNRKKDQPFFLYYPMSHIHLPIVRTPDSKPDASPAQLYIDNVAYTDKLVGKLIDELDRLGLRENTLVLFTGDNGTAQQYHESATVNGKVIHGSKRSLDEGGCRVPLIANWPGTTPAGVVNHDLIDFSDFFATFADVGGAALPQSLPLDSHSFAAPLKGTKGTPREWVYVELDGHSFTRDARYKLTNSGELFDMKDAPWQEIPIPADTQDADAIAARLQLQKVLDEHPAAPSPAATTKPKSNQTKPMPATTQK